MTSMCNRQEPKPCQQCNDSDYCLLHGYSGSKRQQSVKRPYQGDDLQEPKRFYGDNADQNNAPRNSFQPSQAPKLLADQACPPGPFPNNTPPNTTPCSNLQSANKVTNPTQSSDKLDSNPIENDKEIITRTIKKKKKPKDADHVLQADVTPPYAVTGRLTMSMGAIFVVHKNDCRNNPAEFDLFNKIQRELKEILQARIYNVMLGHEVGPVVDIVARYRSKYPRETDKEVMALAHEAHLKYQGLSKEALKAAISQMVT